MHPLRILNDYGYKAYYVGGYVRDFLRGVPNEDIDIATNCQPQTASNIFTSEGYRVIATGIKHGTITVVDPDKRVYEVTTFRRDVVTDGRHAVVEFTDSMEEDAMRRDFTMNALYMDASGKIEDPTGRGLEDISNPVVTWKRNRRMILR